MVKLVTLLQSLKAQPRQLTAEEDRYLNELGDELRRANSDAARWRILEREGIHAFDWSDADQDVLDRMTALHRAALN